MRILLLVTIAALPLAACDIQRTNKDDKTVTFNASDNGAVAFQVPGVKGNIKLPGTMRMHGDMDIDGVKIFPDSRVGSVNVNDQDVVIGFKSPGTVATVKDYYAKQFAEKGVSVTADGDGFTGKTKDGDDFALTLADSGGATAGTMKIHDKE
ncbi:hypothetical protein SPAN111604_04760 [Sphingomonas antarctica]|uniref:hypothetical protein n=1 Tax=Sphingomonas antarctica TaxID=2040274 RepID=UPI0039EB17F8